LKIRNISPFGKIVHSRGINASWIAREVGLSSTMIYHYMYNRSIPGKKNIKKLVKLLNIGPEIFNQGKGSNENKGGENG
jgi:hypothetical protein